MLGADLLNYQMNQDLTPSIFNGQSILEKNLNDEEIELIKQYLSDMNKIKINNINITQKIPMGNLHEWKPNIFKNFFSYIDNLIENSKLDEEKKKLLAQKKSQINSIINPQGRFKEVESQTSSDLINVSRFTIE